MDEIITCTLMDIASTTLFDLQSNPSGRQVWMGVRVRTEDGKTRFFPGMVVESEASLLLQAALDRGERVELWLSGKAQRAYPYAIRTPREEWYGDDFSGHLQGQAIKFFVIGIVTLPFLGMGVFGLIAAIQYLFAASTFSARQTRAEFERGVRSGVPAPMTGQTHVEVSRVAA